MSVCVRACVCRVCVHMYARVCMFMWCSLRHISRLRKSALAPFSRLLIENRRNNSIKIIVRVAFEVNQPARGTGSEHLRNIVRQYSFI